MMRFAGVSLWGRAGRSAQWVLVLAAVQAAFTAPAGAQQCPESNFCLACSEPDACNANLCYPSQDPQRDVTVEDVGTARGAYDLTIGWILSENRGWFDGNEDSSVIARDDFEVVAPPGAGAHTFSITLSVSGATNAGSVYARLRDLDGMSDDVLVSSPVTSSTFHDTLRVQLTGSPGTVFQIEYALGSNAFTNSWSGIQGTLGFQELPPDWSVQSCQGFGAGAVPTRLSTWGELKSLYR